MKPGLDDLVLRQTISDSSNSEKLTVQTAIQQIATIIDKLEEDQKIKVLDIGTYQATALATKSIGYQETLESVAIGKRNISITIT